MTEEWLARFRRGDPEVFRTLVEMHSPRLLALAWRFVDDSDSAHDLVQDGWVRAFRRRTTYSGRGSVLGWLLAVLRSEALDRRKRPQLETVACADRVDRVEDGEPDALDRTVREETRGRALSWVADLPERQRDVVVLRLVEGRSIRETAERLSCAEGTVKATLHQALNALRKRAALHSTRSTMDARASDTPPTGRTEETNRGGT